MREIRFRGKELYTGEWVEGYYVKGVVRHGIVKSFACSPRYDVIPETVGQFTGLYDITKWEDLTEAEKEQFYRENNSEDGKTIKYPTVESVKHLWKGKKIFEGDIVLYEDECPTNYEYHDCTEMRLGEVKFDDGEFYLTNRIAVEMGDLIYYGKLEGKVVGNKHDNPELFTESEDTKK